MRCSWSQLAGLAALLGVIGSGCTSTAPSGLSSVRQVSAQRPSLTAEASPVVRAQTPSSRFSPALPPVSNWASGQTATAPSDNAPGSEDHLRGPMRISGGQPATVAQAGSLPAPEGRVVPAQFAAPLPVAPGPGTNPGMPAINYPDGQQYYPPGRTADLDVYVSEAQTGRFMFGVGVNSDAGLTGQIVIDERNFDWRRVPTSWGDFVNRQAFRGAGQGFRIEALPGTQVQRYMVSFDEPYLLDTNISFRVSAYWFDRSYFDWSENRFGGRIGLGTRSATMPDLSFNGSLRAERVDVSRPRILGVAELDEVLGKSELYTVRFEITHDTRDAAFSATEGHLFQIYVEQGLGTFDYPRGGFDYRQYFLMRQRPDGSGRHVLGFSYRADFSGGNTPLYEHFFAGGFSTIRGFDFRGASPLSGGVIVGGEFMFLGSVDYTFPITANDMIKGTVFCDYGTVEEKINFESDDFRVSVGVGLRIYVPAMGPAPIALDFAVPLHREGTDQIQNFSFFIGLGR